MFKYTITCVNKYLLNFITQLFKLLKNATSLLEKGRYFFEKELICSCRSTERELDIITWHYLSDIFECEGTFLFNA